MSTPLRGRAAAYAIWEAALAAAAPAPLVESALRRDRQVLSAGQLSLDLSRVARVLVLGAGKASAAMVVAVEEILGDRIDGGLVVVKDGYVRPAKRLRVLEAGHPIPDARGQRAVAELLELAESAREDDLVVFLLSGGASALLPAPAPPITIEDKRALTRLLLEGGADIRDLNAVRKHLSLVKGGQLARAAEPAFVLTLALSDVTGNPLDVIGSGPTAPDQTTYADALSVLDRFGIRDRAPASVRERLEAGDRGELPETPKPDDPLFARVTNVVIGDNSLVADAAARQAAELGYAAHVATRELSGEARDVARQLIGQARALTAPACLVAAGETTVTVRGTGLGGRCQEFALAAATALGGASGVTVLAAGTDGTDGPTDAAGAVADHGTVSRAARKGLDAAAYLAANDSHRFFRELGDLIVPGPTCTNLLDLYLVIVDAAPPPSLDTTPSGSLDVVPSR
jgi:glycerate 2-kinase